MVITATTITAFGKEVAKKIAISIVADIIKSKGKSFLPDESAYTKELETTIYNTIYEFDSLFPIPDEGEKFAFYKSEILIQSLLTIKFIGRNTVNIDEVKKLLEQNPNIIAPRQTDVFKFLDLFKQNCQKNQTLIQHQFTDNYKEAIFEILSVVDLIQSTLNKIISEIRTSLTEEYFAQLGEVQQNLNSFKPKTALERLEGLEKRITEKSRMTPEIESRLLFLKGNCILEINKSLKGAELIIQSYLTINNGSLKIEAALSYLNLGENEKALALVNEILKTDPFNGMAWFSLLVLKDATFMEVWNEIPKVVKQKRGFTVNLIYHLLHTKSISEFPLEELGLKLPDDKDEKFTHANFSLWEKIAIISAHNYFSAVKQFTMDEKGKLHSFNTDGLDELVALLKKFFDVIKGTELYAHYPMLRFYYAFCRHLLNDNGFNVEEFQEDYLKMKNSAFQFDLHYAEYLANNGKLEEAIKILNESKFSSEQVVFLHRIIYTRANAKSDAALQLLKEHIEIIEEIDFGSIFNLNNLFSLFGQENSSLREEFDKILSKKRFETAEIKELFRITIQIHYFPTEISHDDFVKALTGIVKAFNHEKAILFYIAQLLYKLDAYKEATAVLEDLIEPNKQTQPNLLYAQARFKGNIELKSLLKFLEDIRLASENNIYDFLAIENNLRQSIDDAAGIIEIAWRGVRQYPNVEHFHINLLSALERKGVDDEIREYAAKHLKKDFRSEKVGIWVSTILSRKGFQQEASQILYLLASKPTNYTARTAYASKLDFPEGFFIDYREVEDSSYVKLASKSKDVKLVAQTLGDKFHLVGKKLGEVVMIPEKFGAGFKEFRVSRIMNNHLFLFEQILEEARDSNSELPIQTFDFSDKNGEFDRDAFEQQIIKKIASEDTGIHKLRQEKIDSYNKGELSFSEVCRAVFNDNPLECYQYLTANTFFALPAYHNSLLQLPAEEVFVLDFTSLILFSDLEKQHGITIDNKFIISASLATVIKGGLIELEAYPPSKMSLAVVAGEVRPIFYPEDYHQNQINKYKELLQFISNHCIEKVNEEKIEFFSFLEKRDKDEPYFDCLIDNAMFCTTLGHALITNDRFIVNQFRHLTPKIISPENFLIRYFRGNFSKNIVDYFVEKHYVGVILNKDVLVNEYKKKQLDKPNSFNTCLSSLKFRWSLSPVNMMVAIKFLKDVYAEGLALDKEKFILSQSVFSNLLDGCSQNEKIISLIEASIFLEFSLMGESLDKVLSAFHSALKIYGR